MVAYSFQRQFADPILIGRKRHTVRGPRRRHAKPGEALQLYTGMHATRSSRSGSTSIGGRRTIGP